MARYNSSSLFPTFDNQGLIIGANKYNPINTQNWMALGTKWY